MEEWHKELLESGQIPTLDQWEEAWAQGQGSSTVNRVIAWLKHVNRVHLIIDNFKSYSAVKKSNDAFLNGLAFSW